MALYVRSIRTVVTVGILGLLTCPMASAAGFETVILKDGQRITGEVVAEKSNALYVDLGYDLLRIPRDQVLRRDQGRRGGLRTRGRRRAAPSWIPPASTRRASLKPSSVKDLVNKYGEAVISIETPSGKGSGLHHQQGRVRDHQCPRDPGRDPGLGDPVHERSGGLRAGGSRTSRSSRLNPFFDLALLKLPLPADLKPSHVVLGNDNDVNAGEGCSPSAIRWAWSGRSPRGS